MEESAKRRERLKAMRVEASEAADNSEAEHSMLSHGLSNPLIETSATDSMPVGYAPQRFDYYTDPMAAFSGNKGRSKVSHQRQQDYLTTRPRPTEMTPPPPQAPTNYTPDQRMYQAQGFYNSAGPIRHGIGTPFISKPGTPGVYRTGGTSPYSFSSNTPRGDRFPTPDFGHGPHVGSPSSNSAPGRGNWFSNIPRPGSGIGAGPGFGQESTPGFNAAQGRGQWFNTSPRSGSGPGGSPSFSPGQGRGNWFDNSPHPGSGPSGRRGSPSFTPGQGRGPWFNNSPGPGSGRGGSPGPRGRWEGNNMSPGSGRGGRGSRSHSSNVSAELRPDLYYNKSMVEDPWKFLKPVIWKRVIATVNNLNTPDSEKTWLPKSVRMKKAKVSEASSDNSSQLSLAEYLAASFNEASKSESVED